MKLEIEPGDLVFLRDWPDESSGDWTISSHPPLLVLEVIESKQIPMFGGVPHTETLVVLDSEGKIRSMPAGYFVSADVRDMMIREIKRAGGR